MAGPRSSSGVVRASTRSRSSATTWPTTRSSSRRRPTCSPSCSRAGRSPGRARPAPSLYDQDVVPHTESGPFPAWIGVGGSPQSVIRAAHYGFSLMLAIIGGSPARFAPFSQLFQQALERFGQSPLPVGVHSPGHVAATDEQARDEFWPRYLEVIRQRQQDPRIRRPDQGVVRSTRSGRTGRSTSDRRKPWPRRSRRTSPTLGATRFDLKYGMGGLAPRGADDEHRALRHAGHPARSRAAGLRGGPLTRRYEWLMTGTGGAHDGYGRNCRIP